LHGNPGSGLSGQAWDRAFDNTGTVVNPSGGALGGIAVNNSTGDVSQFASWTVTGWYRRENGGAAPSGGTVLAQSPTSFSPNGSIPGLGTVGFGVRWHSADTLRTNINGSLLTGSGSGWGLIDEWVFFAVTYDGTQTSNNVNYYRGFTDSHSGDPTVQLVGTTTFGGGGVVNFSQGFVIGNRTDDFSRSFDGWIDNVQVFGAYGDFESGALDPSGALSLAQLEAVRLADLNFVPIPEPGAGLAVLAGAAIALARFTLRRRKVA
jgi:hypothetical protein